MSNYYNDLITGLNEAIAIERGELKGRKTVTDSIVQEFINEGNKEFVKKNAGCKTNIRAAESRPS